MSTHSENEQRPDSYQQEFLNQWSLHYPDFNCIETYFLYRFDYRMPLKILQAIRRAPRERMTADLCSVLEDAESRQDDLINEQEEHTWYVIHALQLLGEFQDAASIPQVCRFLSSDVYFTEYWELNHFEQSVTHYFAAVGLQDLPALFDFICHSRANVWHKMCVLEGVGLALINAEAEQQKVVDWLEQLLIHFLNTDSRPFADRELLFSELSLLYQHLDAHRLEPMVKALFDRGWVDETYHGSWQKIIKNKAEQVREYCELPGTIESFYESAHKIEMQYFSEGDEDEFDEDEFEFDQADYSGNFVDRVLNETFHDKTPSWIFGPKISRNEACPCGSGKKYKRCHGKGK